MLVESFAIDTYSIGKVSSWTWQGKPVPFAPSPSQEDACEQAKTQKTVTLTPIFLEKMKDIQNFEKALIKVENIRCPILLISGKEDKMWPSTLYCELIMKRLDAFKSTISRQHLAYDGAGHMITSPYAPVMVEAFKHPVTGLLYEIGGEAKAQAFACKDSWEKMLDFLASTSR